MAALTAAVANGGTRYQPVIWDSICDASNQIIQRSESRVIGKLPASEQTLAIVRRGLWGAVNGEKGTARRIHSVDIDVSGKTGTSQVVSRRSTEGLKASEIPAHLRAHAWFVAYAPSSQPQIAVAVIVEHGEHGSSAAAPIAKEVIRTYLGPAGGQSAVARNDDGALNKQGG
jgi:penicillin-binding protein 2